MTVIPSTLPQTTARFRSPRRKPLALAVALALAPAVLLAQQPGTGPEQDQELETTVVVGTAADELKQSLGVSIITRDDIERRPPTNDLADLLRTMPGVNFTGNSSSGQYGNNRQIDLRGMGPENTLILIDGKPVGSRDSIRMGRSGERNTRGDTNWVPADAVERIEVLRGPAAARYGSGASGGVINIITRKPSDNFSGSVSLFHLSPHHDEEGGGERAGFQLSGPIARDFSFRLFGNVNKTEADSLALNADYAVNPDAVPPAGREGVRNRDLNALLRWDPVQGQVFELEGGFSRQGNIYAGDRAVSSTGSPLLDELANAGAETNTMYRRSAALSHRGEFDWGSSRLSLSREDTDNKRLMEGLAGGVEGSISTDNERVTSHLKNTLLHGEVNLPRTIAGHSQVITLGVEFRDSRLDDPYSVSQSDSTGGGVPGLGDRSGKADAQTTAVYAESNVYVGDNLVLTPGLRFDHHSQFGNHIGPSLNAQYHFTDDLSLKGGVARAFKAPNLYQSNDGYLYYTMGNGCPVDYPSLGQGCYIKGNSDLDAETSLNKEIGVEWAPTSGYHASITYFHNDYKDKIDAGMVPIGLTPSGQGRIFEWSNSPKAVVQGVEGNLVVPLLGEAGRVLRWNNNITWMIENENKETGQPLSVIPEYTLNTSLDWRATDKLSLLLTGAFYGDQESASQQSTTGAPMAPDVREAYNLWSLSGRYAFTDKISVGAGINNLFDKRLFRETNSNTAAGTGIGSAATYNEPGRAFYVSLNLGF